MMATVPHVTSGLGLRKFQADGFLLTRVYLCRQEEEHRGRKTCNNTMQGASSNGGTCCLLKMAEIFKLTVTQYVLSLEVVL